MDGICGYCEERRRCITYLHKQFPKTNPEYESADREQNSGWHLSLYEVNGLPYPSIEKLLDKFDPLFDHPIRENKDLMKKTKECLSALYGLERHYRLSLMYLRRNRLITKDFVKGLGRD